MIHTASSKDQWQNNFWGRFKRSRNLKTMKDCNICQVRINFHYINWFGRRLVEIYGTLSYPWTSRVNNHCEQMFSLIPPVGRLSNKRQVKQGVFSPSIVFLFCSSETPLWWGWKGGYSINFAQENVVASHFYRFFEECNMEHFMADKLKKLLLYLKPSKNMLLVHKSASPFTKACSILLTMGQISLESHLWFNRLYSIKAYSWWNSIAKADVLYVADVYAKLDWKFNISTRLTPLF